MHREIIQEETGHYLRIVGEKEETYSDKIFFYQEIPGFLPMEIRHINGRKEYLYDISGRISLEEYWAGENFEVKDIAGIFIQILDMAAVLEEYLLDGRGIILRSEYLFMDSVTGEVGGIYQNGGGEGILSGLGRLTEEILNEMNQSDKELLLFVYRIHRMTKERSCTKSSLREYLAESSEQLRQQPQKEFPAELQLDERDDKNNAEGICTGEDVNSHSIREGRRHPAEWGSYLLPVLLVAVCLGAMGILWQRGVFQKSPSGETDYVKLGACCVFASCVAGYGIWKTLPSKTFPENCDGDICYDESERSGESSVCLVPESGDSEPVSVSRPLFRMDKIKISQEHGEVSVTDEDSDRGVFLNGKRLVPWHKQAVRDGDVLCFSGKSYVVEIAEWISSF